MQHSMIQKRTSITPIKSFKKILLNFFISFLIIGYRCLPLSIPTKTKIKFFLFKKNSKLKKIYFLNRHCIFCLYINSIAIKYTALFFNLFNFFTFTIKSKLFLIYEARHIGLKGSNKPLVSIIIPIYGKIEFTIRCLKSISLNLPKCTFEIIVIDDSSPDNSLSILKFVKGIKIFKNSTNKGFIYSCNFGARKAKGKYLYFLNNDTLVTPGWLDHLVQTFKNFPGTGLAGSKLLYPNGRLQEAGGIIWKDGSAWNFGRYQDPNDPVFNYAREVDYCSGASIMIPKVIFNKMKGFDSYYSPAYCEDSDLALRLRDRGYRVIYQPFSIVIHFEGITSGKDINSGAKSYQVFNLQKQYNRWKQRLLTYQENGENIDKAKDRRASRRVLYLDLKTPSPYKDSGSVDVFNHMLLLREMNFQVTFIAVDNISYIALDTPNLQRNGIEVLYYPYIKSVKEHLKNMGDRYDLVIFSRVETAQRFISAVKAFCKKAKRLFISVDLHFLRLERIAILEKSNSIRIVAKKIKKQELDIMKRMDISTVISTYEYDLLLKTKKTLKAKMRLLPYTRQIHKKIKSFDDRKNIVFLGGFSHKPNIDAVKFFVSEIMPHIRKFIPDLKFYIVGSEMTEEIKALKASDIVVQGFVQDLSSFLSTFKLSVAPLRVGAGIKGKIGTSLSIGLPVISTSIGVEGMGLKNKENVIIENKAKVFAEKLVSTYKDKRLWDKLSKNGLAYAKKKWGANKGYYNLSSILKDLDFSIQTKSYPLTLHSD
jgi:GT2 family glycosyltransferase